MSSSPSSSKRTIDLDGLVLALQAELVTQEVLEQAARSDSVSCKGAKWRKRSGKTDKLGGTLKVKVGRDPKEHFRWGLAAPRAEKAFITAVLSIPPTWASIPFFGRKLGRNVIIGTIVTLVVGQRCRRKEISSHSQTLGKCKDLRSDFACRLKSDPSVGRKERQGMSPDWQYPSMINMILGLPSSVDVREPLTEDVLVEWFRRPGQKEKYHLALESDEDGKGSNSLPGPTIVDLAPDDDESAESPTMLPTGTTPSVSDGHHRRSSTISLASLNSAESFEVHTPPAESPYNNTFTFWDRVPISTDRATTIAEYDLSVSEDRPANDSGCLEKSATGRPSLQPLRSHYEFQEALALSVDTCSKGFTVAENDAVRVLLELGQARLARAGC